MRELKYRIWTLAAIAALFVVFSSGVVVTAYGAEAASDYPSKAEVRNSLLNPHNQINDEGIIKWNTCLICHPVVPDIDRARSIKDVKLYFEDDLKQGCYRCHIERVHPGGEWLGRTLRGKVGAAPNHLIVPPEMIKHNMDMAVKESFTMLPLDPKSGKIFCGTCHNPHERGLLKGRADTGADKNSRLRSSGRTICQFCHRK